jgi:hypothetical protein
MTTVHPAAAHPPPPPPPPPPAGAGAPISVDRAAERSQALGRAALASAGIGTALLAGRAMGLHLPACPLRSLTGVPCPACGTTRLADALAHGRVGDAISADPIGVVLLAVIAVGAVVMGVSLLRDHPLPRALGTWGVIAVLVALAGVRWATTIVGGIPTL